MRDKDSTAHRRAVDLARGLQDSRDRSVRFDLAEELEFMPGVGTRELIEALLDSLLLVIDEAAAESGRDAEEYLLAVELERTDRHG
ncbi:hypothetical protein AB0E27_41445 [Streptomyces sparsogenes]|uniref:hypothetical protein n=1 Tax=Streptomyces sparsogenes TaxID=67365 RepID=UPI00340F0AA5